MRLKTVSTKSNNNYAIIADYKKLNGKKETAEKVYKDNCKLYQ